MSGAIEVKNENLKAKTNEMNTIKTSGSSNGSTEDFENKDEQQYLDLIEKIINTGF